MWYVKKGREIVSPQFKLKRNAKVWMETCGVAGCFVAGGRKYGI